MQANDGGALVVGNASAVEHAVFFHQFKRVCSPVVGVYRHHVEMRGNAYHIVVAAVGGFGVCIVSVGVRIKPEFLCSRGKPGESVLNYDAERSAVFAFVKHSGHGNDCFEIV